MDINHWNEITQKSQKAAEQYDKRIRYYAGKKLDGNTFICPWCGKEYSLSDAHVKEISAGNELIDTEYHMNSTTKTYAKISYRIRFCKKCIEKNKRHKRIFLNVAKGVYAISSALLLYWLITTDVELGFYGWFGIIFIYGIATLCAWAFKEDAGEFLFDVVDIIKAYENNAIV